MKNLLFLFLLFLASCSTSKKSTLVLNHVTTLNETDTICEFKVVIERDTSLLGHETTPRDSMLSVEISSVLHVLHNLDEMDKLEGMIKRTLTRYPEYKLSHYEIDVFGKYNSLYQNMSAITRYIMIHNRLTHTYSIGVK